MTSGAGRFGSASCVLVVFFFLFFCSRPELEWCGLVLGVTAPALRVNISSISEADRLVTFLMVGLIWEGVVITVVVVSRHVQLTIAELVRQRAAITTVHGPRHTTATVYAHAVGLIDSFWFIRLPLTLASNSNNKMPVPTRPTSRSPPVSIQSLLRQILGPARRTFRLGFSTTET